MSLGDKMREISSAKSKIISEKSKLSQMKWEIEKNEKEEEQLKQLVRKIFHDDTKKKIKDAANRGAYSTSLTKCYYSKTDEKNLVDSSTCSQLVDKYGNFNGINLKLEEGGRGIYGGRVYSELIADWQNEPTGLELTESDM